MRSYSCGLLSTAFGRMQCVPFRSMVHVFRLRTHIGECGYELQYPFRFLLWMMNDIKGAAEPRTNSDCRFKFVESSKQKHLRNFPDRTLSLRIFYSWTSEIAPEKTVSNGSWRNLFHDERPKMADEPFESTSNDSAMCRKWIFLFLFHSPRSAVYRANHLLTQGNRKWYLT